jgi:Raf kinase inhibitor-like YbhB/YbcL family protein
MFFARPDPMLARRHLCVALLLPAVLALSIRSAPQVQNRSKGALTMTLSLHSPDFADGATIPRAFTCEGEDRSPALDWSDAPVGTKSFALIADDPDAPVRTWVHWVIYDIPAGVRSLPGDLQKKERLADGSLQGQNDFRKIGYNGPCPPPGKPHRYFFHLYALSKELTLSPGVTKADVERAMRGHILAQAQWMGRYQR